MSTEQNYTSGNEPTNPVGRMVGNDKSASGKSPRTRVNRSVKLEFGLDQNDEGDPSPAESLYLILLDACHSTVTELEGIDQVTDNETFFARNDQLHRIHETQSDLVRSLFARYSELSNTHSSANQRLCEKEVTIKQLAKDLDFTRSLALTQAELIEQLKSQNSNFKEGQPNG